MNRETVTLITAVVGAVCGVLGAVLGVMNTWNQMSKNRVRLRVVPKLAWFLDSSNVLTTHLSSTETDSPLRSRPPDRLGIEVVNLSAFAVTVSDVGFGRLRATRAIALLPELSTGKSWPVRLESRDSFTAYFRADQSLPEPVLKHPVAYAETDCGAVTYGKSPALRQYVMEVLAARGKKT